MFRIFKEFTSYIDIFQGDEAALALHIIGGLLIGITFFMIGIICIVMAHKGNRSKRRQTLASIFGLFLISCSFSRFTTVLCIWHNYAILDGWIKVLTGLLAFFAVLYLPKTVKEVLDEKILDEAHKTLEKTQQELAELRQITEKLNK